MLIYMKDTQMIKDWADKLVDKKKKRGDNSITPQQLREQVKYMCESNIERWKGEEWNTEEEKETAYKKEEKRLIQLRKEEDDREQFEYEYAQKGIEIIADHVQKRKISSVKFPFSNEEWVDLLNKEGEYLHHCCADISSIRNILQDACRENYHIKTKDLYELICLAKHHGFKKDKTPIGRLFTLWNTIKKDVANDKIHVKCTNLENPEEALEVLYLCAANICWDNLLASPHINLSDQAKRNYDLATIQSAVRTLYLKLNDLYKGPVEGFAVVDSNNKLAYTQRGLSIFKDKKTAQNMCNEWNKNKKKPIYKIEKARVSMEDGFQII